MDPAKLKQALTAGKVPTQARILVAGGKLPLPTAVLLELLVFVLDDDDPEVRSQAAKTLSAWDEEEVRAELHKADCHPSVLEYFSQFLTAEESLRAIIANPSTPDSIVSSLAQTASASLLDTILDNRVRIIRFPEILENVRKNPESTPEILRLAHEINAEFLVGKKADYSVGEASSPTGSETVETVLSLDVPEGDLSLEGLPLDPEDRQNEIVNRLSGMSVREKMRYALFGNREIRSALIRDSNKEVAHAVLRSPKITDSEIEAISAMRGVAEDILREIGRSRAWTKSYTVVQNLVKNPKTPPQISQHLIFRLRAPDLLQLTRDRSVPDAVRYNAGRTLRQRSTRPSP